MKATASLIGALHERLDQHRLPGGGYSLQPGGPARSDATAWAALALGTTRSPEPASLAWLERAQLGDGAVVVWEEGGPPPTRHAYTPDWVTAPAVLAWSLGQPRPPAHARAAGFLLRSQGRQIDSKGSIVAHDGMIPGWAWVSGTHSWVEPTCLALLALQTAPDCPERTRRTEQGRRLLLDRQLPEGGWNYGNTRVFQAALRPTAEATALALATLEVTGGAPDPVGLIQRLASEPLPTAPLACGWMAIALRRHLPQAKLIESLASSLHSESTHASYPLEWLAVLALAAHAVQGLPLPWDALVAAPS